MAKKQNPYQLWLGLHPKLTNPNLFQLLGVDPRSQDEAAIKQKAIASAKMLLQRLKAVEPKSDAEKVFKQKLHAKIVLAHDTIIAPQKRKQYLNALLANSAAQKKTAAPPISPPPSTSAEHPASPNSAENSAPNPIPAPTPAPPTPTPPPLNPGLASPPLPPEQIPTAIPMAMPVSPALAATNDAEGASEFSMGDATAQPARPAQPSFDNLDAQPQVKVYARKRKTSRSWLVPIVVLTLIVGGVGGLVSMMTKYSNIFELIPSLKEKVVVVSTDPAQAGAGESKPTPLKVPEMFADVVKQQAAEETEMEIPQGSMSKPDAEAEKEQPKKDKQQMKPEGEKSQNDSLDAENTNAKKPVMEGSSAKVRSLKDSELSSLRLALHRSRDALFRQDGSLAKHFNSDVKDLLKRYKIKNTKTIAPKQRGLVRAVKTNEQVIGWVDDFWEQVKLSSIEIAGGESIVVGGKTMALVEATDEGVVLRITGQNERIPYRDLTPILATTLGEKGSKQSVPRWNLAQAAYLGVMAAQYPDARQLQFRILNQVKIDGFDIESQVISDYTDPDWLGLGLPKEKLKPLSDDRFQEIIANQRKRLNYKNPTAVPVDRVDALIYQLTLNLREDPAVRVARLWEAVAMIKKGHRIFDLMYVNRELNDCCTEVDFDRSFVDPILQIASEEKAPGFQDQLARQIIVFIKQFDGNRNLTRAMRAKLLKGVKKIAKDLENHQLSAMAGRVSAGSQ